MNWVVANVKPGQSNYYAWLSGSRELPPEYLNRYLNARASGYKTSGQLDQAEHIGESAGAKVKPPTQSRQPETRSADRARRPGHGATR